MDEHQLDRVTRNVARVLDRRRGLQGLLALGAVPLGVTMLGSTEVAEADGKCKPSCGECQHCKKGKCHKTNRGKQHCKKGKCKPKDNGTTCSTGTCQAGVCQSTTPPPPPCTGLKPTATGATKGLQEAIDAAETGDTLTLCAGTWSLTSTVQITKNLTLIGAGVGATVVDGGDAVQVLSMATGTIVTLQNLTITEGNAFVGGGILNKGTLTLREVSVTGNTAGSSGGGIRNEGTLTLEAGSSVTGNSTGGGGGGIFNIDAMVELRTGSSVTGNTSGIDGAGIKTLRGTVAMQMGSSVTGNAGLNGGGIYITDGTVTLQTGSSVTGNTARNSGGGIFNNNGTANVESATILTDNAPTNCSGQAVSPPTNCIG